MPLSPPFPTTCTAFAGERLVATGPLDQVALAAKRAVDAGAAGPLLVFDDRTSQPVYLDLRGSEADVLARLPGSQPRAQRRPGRPKLGVVSREVTLLPRHWEWLGQQPEGASAFLRRLVEEEMRGGRGRARAAAASVDRFMLAMTGNLPGHEEVSRAFWRGERERFAALTESWPVDVRDHLRRLAAASWDAAAT